MDAEVCGLDGKEEETVQTRSLNRLINRIRIHHVEPMKKDLCSMKKTLGEHIDDEAEVLAEIRGALKVLKVIGLTALFILAVQDPLAKIIMELIK